MSDDNVIYINEATTEDIPPERVVGAALDAKLSVAIVIGRRPDGSIYFASSTGDVKEAHWLVSVVATNIVTSYTSLED
jgi:hypothetical protein